MSVSDDKMKEAMDFIADLLARLESKGGEREYIFRGAKRRYNEMTQYKAKKNGINSTLYRWATSEGKEDVFNTNFFPHHIEKDTVKKARRLLPRGSKEVEILTDMQHYGGKTNLIDFSHNVFIALFFACNGEYAQNGELIMLERKIMEERENINYHYEDNACREVVWLIAPIFGQRSDERVRFQSSVFARPKSGYIDEKICVIEPIQKQLKKAILAYLAKYHNIKESTVYNDMLGFMGNENNYETAAFYFYKGAAKYRKGYKTEAARWYRKAAAQGLAVAQYNLGVLYFTGEGVKPNGKEAEGWFRKAGEGEISHAWHNLGYMYANGKGVMQDKDKALECYHKAAELGLAASQTTLGFMYINGDGVKKDNQMAAKWYLKAAEQGSAYAQTNLGWMYEKGEGVQRDTREAVKWYRKAAEQGIAQAQFNLGSSYYEGVGVAQDKKEAYIWVSLAAINGDEKAKSARKIAEAKLIRAELREANEEIQKRLKEIDARKEENKQGNPIPMKMSG